MAIVKGTFGTALVGRVGNVVFKNTSDGNVASALPTSVKNPRTATQMRQRAIMATAGAAYAALKDVCDHSFEGVTYGKNSMAAFMSENLNWFKTQADGDGGNFKLKALTGMSVMDTILSKGSIVLKKNFTGGDFEDGSFLNIDKADKLATMTFAQFLGMFGIQKGDELAFIVADSEKGGYVKFGSAYQQNAVIRKARITIGSAIEDTLMFKAVKVDDTTGKISETGTLTAYVFNTTCLDTEKSENYDSIVIWENANKDHKVLDIAEDGVVYYEQDCVCCGLAVIVSRYENGKWLRSNTHLSECKLSEAAGTVEPVTIADATESYNPSSPLYLNNAQK